MTELSPMTGAETTGAPWIDYDYAVVRLVPRVDRGAYMNVGVVMHSRRGNFLAAHCAIDRAAVAAFAPALDLDLLDRSIAAYCLVCEGGPGGGPLGVLPASERFHWLTAPRSAVIQTSPVHPGRCRDLSAELERLFGEMVGGE